MPRSGLRKSTDHDLMFTGGCLIQKRDLFCTIQGVVSRPMMA